MEVIKICSILCVLAAQVLLVPSKAQPCSEWLWELVWWQPLSLQSTGEKCSAVPCGLAPTQALLSSKISQLSSLLLPF